MKWKGLVGAAATAVLACGPIALAADDQSLFSTSGSALTSPMMMDDAAATAAAAPATAPAGPPPTPLMGAIGSTSFGKWLTANQLNITGFGEVGYFYDMNNPRLGGGPGGDAPTFITFPGAYSNRFLVDQIDLSISRSLDTTKKWDWGFLFENGYGTDDAQIHSHGMLDNAPVNHPQNQYDIVQANVQLFLPVGTGLTLTGGKFVAFLGQEVINPTGNQFYTHSYTFFYGIPATNTGIEAAYTFAKAVNGNDLSVSGGFTRGWNQSTSDNNGAIDFLGQAKSSLTDKLSWIFNTEIGPEAAGDNHDYWASFEALISYTVSDQLSVNGDFTYTDFPHGAVPAGGHSAPWGGVAAYALYKYNSYVNFNARGEWYGDEGAFTTGTQANYYEVTLGLGIHPAPNDPNFQFLQIRPELREDWSDHRVYNFSHDGGRGDLSETTAAVDVIMQF